MTERLVQCPGCSRHVKSRDAACPFCGARMTTAGAPSRTPFERMKTAAAVAAGVAAIAACADTEVLLPSLGRPFVSNDAGSSGGDDQDSGFEPGPSGVVFYGSPGIGPIERPDASRPAPGVADAGSPDDAAVEASDEILDGGADASSDASSDGGEADGADGA